MTCFVGGLPAALERGRPVIECRSKHIVAMGAVGSGQMTKLCNNALTVSNMRNVVEVFAMADKLGVSLAGVSAQQQRKLHTTGFEREGDDR